MSICVLLSVSVCASVVLGQEFSIGSEVPESCCEDETLEKDTEEDTMEYMDNLKEVLDASITPLSELNVDDLSGDITEDGTDGTTAFNPYEYIRKRKQPTVPTLPTGTLTKKVPTRKRGRVGRPRKTTLFPMVSSGINMTKNAVEGPKKRMKWDNNMNKFIMYTYYYVTKLETDKKDYRQRMKEKFVKAYPEWETVNVQRLADQKRSIRQNRLLDVDTLREIKRTVKKELELEGVELAEVAEDSRDKSFYD